MVILNNQQTPAKSISGKSRTTKCTIKKKHRVKIPLQRGGETNNESAKIYGGKKNTLRKSPSETFPNHCIGENLSETLGPRVKL